MWHSLICYKMFLVITVLFLCVRANVKCIQHWCYSCILGMYTCILGMIAFYHFLLNIQYMNNFQIACIIKLYIYTMLPIFLYFYVHLYACIYNKVYFPDIYFSSKSESNWSGYILLSGKINLQGPHPPLWTGLVSVKWKALYIAISSKIADNL